MTVERWAYVNGAFVPERDAKVSIHDLGFVFGDAVYDTARTFKGEIFKLEEHVSRLFESLRYARIDPGLTPGQVAEATRELVERNLPYLREGEDYWVTQRISRGLIRFDGEEPEYEGATVVIECVPIPFRARARYFRDGIPVVTPSVRRTPPQALSPRAKTTNYLNMTMGALEVKAQAPDAWAVLLDENGNLCEGIGANIFLVKDGALFTPKEDYILPGISRATVIDLAREIGVACVEKDLAPHDAYLADEAFLTSTSLCLCPVASYNGQTVAEAAVPGPVTKRLLEAYSDLVGLDIVQQYLNFLGNR
jgi:branched-chain amino acid aminotransferase